MNNITNDDLKKNQYSEDVLKNNIDRLFQCIIVKTQKNLSKEFIDEYILNEKYSAIPKDSDITCEILKNYQPQYFN